jgi:hypothetical protein
VGICLAKTPLRNNVLLVGPPPPAEGSRGRVNGLHAAALWRIHVAWYAYSKLLRPGSRDIAWGISQIVRRIAVIPSNGVDHRGPVQIARVRFST